MTAPDQPSTRRAARQRAATQTAVFVDPSGRRARRARRAVVTLAVGVTAAVALVGVAVTTTPDLRPPILPGPVKPAAAAGASRTTTAATSAVPPVVTVQTPVSAPPLGPSSADPATSGVTAVPAGAQTVTSITPVTAPAGPGKRADAPGQATPHGSRPPHP